MKIEDSPYQFGSPVEKLRRVSANGSFDATLDELDLSFLDLLTSVTTDGKTNAGKGAQVDLSKADAAEKPSASVTTLTGKISKSATRKEELPEVDEGEFHTAVDDDMRVLRDELTLLDVQYLKQTVIPGLPILVGSVPFNSIFPVGEDGQISYKGFEVSPKLSELIEKGYKTGRPIRVELDAQSAVVLKIRNGQVSAEFVSADKAAAFVMQQELSELRNRMAARNLPVGTLEYKYQNPDQSRREQPKDDDNSHA